MEPVPIEDLIATKPLTAEAKIELVTRFEPFTHMMTRRIAFVFKAKQVGDYEDWFQETTIALLEAAERYRGDRGARFITFAYVHVWLRLRSVLNNGKRDLIRVPSNWWRLKQRQALVRHFRVRQFGIDDKGRSMADTILARDEIDPMTEEIGVVLDVMEKELKEREQSVLMERFGMNQEQEEKTLREIGRKLQISRERVRQLEVKAMEKLRKKIFGRLEDRNDRRTVIFK